MKVKPPKLLLTLLLSFFFMVMGTGSLMVCEAAVPSCDMGCHGESVRMTPSASAIAVPSAEPCCTISQAPTVDPTTVQQTQSAQPQPVLFVAQILSYLSSPDTASHAYLHFHPSVANQAPIFILNRTLLI